MLSVTDFLGEQLAIERTRLQSLTAGDPGTRSRRVPIENRVSVLEDLLSWAGLYKIGPDEFRSTLLRIRDSEPNEFGPIGFRHDVLNLAPRVADELLKALAFADVVASPDPAPRVARQELLRILRRALGGHYPWRRSLQTRSAAKASPRRSKRCRPQVCWRSTGGRAMRRYG